MYGTSKEAFIGSMADLVAPEITCTAPYHRTYSPRNTVLQQAGERGREVGEEHPLVLGVLAHSGTELGIGDEGDVRG